MGRYSNAISGVELRSRTTSSPRTACSEGEGFEMGCDTVPAVIVKVLHIRLIYVHVSSFFKNMEFGCGWCGTLLVILQESLSGLSQIVSWGVTWHYNLTGRLYQSVIFSRKYVLTCFHLISMANQASRSRWSIVLSVLSRSCYALLILRWTRSCGLEHGWRWLHSSYLGLRCLDESRCSIGTIRIHG